jgi:hypothetical protein
MAQNTMATAFAAVPAAISNPVLRKNSVSLVQDAEISRLGTIREARTETGVSFSDC